jgi:hypothetical protein
MNPEAILLIESNSRGRPAVTTIPLACERDLCQWLEFLFETYKIFHDDINLFLLWDRGFLCIKIRDRPQIIEFR